MIMKLTTVVAALISMTAMTAQAHVGLSYPCGRYQPAAGCPKPPAGQSIDYDINTPVGTHDSKNFPLCKHTVPYTDRTVFNAGQTINTAYSVGASHGGGHCQYALSYDDGKTWVVIKTVIRECLQGVTNGQQYHVPVKIPSDAPSGKATFMWLWNNAIGNRELYSNCADIEIKGKEGGQITGVEPLIANYGSDSFYIGEFPGANDQDGNAEFAKRKAITVRANGSSNPEPPKPTTVAPKPTTTTTAAPKPTTVAPKPTTPTTTVAPKPTTTAAPKPTKTVAPRPTKTVTVTKIRTKFVTKTKTKTKTRVIKPTCKPRV
ncbi:hypothetical protein BGZ76_007159 [Entomortierella beljakovae]|nr:hypothetical protein BGZ76_007159 [Entomortierella beljakovae]